MSQLRALLALYGSCNPLPPTAAGSLWLTPLWAAGSALGGGPLINSHSAAEGWIGLLWESCACCTCILTSFWAGEGLPVHCYSESLSYHGRTVVKNNALDEVRDIWACRSGRVPRGGSSHMFLTHESQMKRRSSLSVCGFICWQIFWLIPDRFSQFQVHVSNNST